MTYQLYGVKNGDTISLDMSPIADGYAPFGYNATRKGYDFVAKPQLHKADNKAESGEGVLLFYNGKRYVGAGLHYSFPCNVNIKYAPWD